MRIDLEGLVSGPSQVWGALRLVPLLRDKPVENLRLHGVAYGDASVSRVKLTNTVSYYSYIPHGFVADWNRDAGDRDESAAYGTQILNKQILAKDGVVQSMPVHFHRRMSQKQGKRRVRFLPLHLAMEGYLALHFGGPTIAWREWSDRVIRNGLSPRSEAAYRGAVVPGLQDALRVFEIHEGQCGVLLYTGDTLAAAFVVPHPDDYRELHPTLLLDMYGELVYQYALMMPAVQEYSVYLDADRIDSLAGLRAAAAEQSRMWTRFHDTVLANALLDHDYKAERAYQMGDFVLLRFRPTFKPGEENHIGEAITDGAGRIAYLKTFRLSETQIRRGYLLELLAAHDWRLARAAEAIGATPLDLRNRIRAAGFEMMLRQKEK